MTGYWTVTKTDCYNIA